MSTPELFPPDAGPLETIEAGDSVTCEGFGDRPMTVTGLNPRKFASEPSEVPAAHLAFWAAGDWCWTWRRVSDCTLVRKSDLNGGK